LAETAAYAQYLAVGPRAIQPVVFNRHKHPSLMVL
jgi:hypothetical protein